MDNKLFKAVIDKIDNEIIDDLEYRQNFEIIDAEKSSNSIAYSLEKKIDLADLDDETRQEIEDKYLSQFEGNEFNDWWTFNGDSYEEQYKQNHKDTENMIIDAYDEWIEENGQKCYEEFNDYISLIKHIDLTINNDYEDKIEFVYDLYYEHDYVSEAKFNEIHTSIFVYEFQFDKLCEILNNKFDLNISGAEKLMLEYLNNYEAKIAKITKKITKQFN